MSAKQESTDQTESKTCRRCGAPLPPQKAGRPRQWCSQQCRQSAYEERHGLENWKDKQPKVNDLSDVVEVMQDRAARRDVVRKRDPKDYVSAHTWGTCVGTVCADQLYMAMVLDAVTDVIIADKVRAGFEGRFLVGGIARLVETVVPGSLRAAPSDVPPAPTRSKDASE